MSFRTLVPPCLPLGFALLVTACPGPPLGADDAGADPSGVLPGLRDGGLPPLSDGGAGADAGPADAGTGIIDAGPDDAGASDAGLTDAGPADAGPQPVLISDEGGPCYIEGGAACEDGLVCAPIFNSGAGTCARPCLSEGLACAGGGTCTDFGPADEPSFACATHVSSGEGCDAEQLVVCAGEGVCLRNDDAPLGGTCRTPCTPATACAPETCVVINEVDDSGYCGTAAQPGESCAPITEGVFCEGNAVCLLDLLGEGTCRSRCAVASDCAGTDECVGADATNDGYCLPTTDLGQGELCTDGADTLTCAADFGCIPFAAIGEGLGLCLEDCGAGGDAVCETGRCYPLEGLSAGAGDRCLTELPRGTHGCSADPPEPRCAGENPVCVGLGEDDSVCKASCTLASCPDGACECADDETCIDSYLASAEIGVCGQLAQRDEPCDDDRDIYCAPAPGQDVQTNAFSACVADACRVICRYESGGEATDLDCPAGLTCGPDPTGRLLPTVHVCREP